MAGVNQFERIGSQNIKAARRGAAHKRSVECIVVELAAQIALAQHNRARGILRLIRRLDHTRRIDRARRGAAKLHRIAHVCRKFGRRMAHHERHNAALATTGIHHALNARLMRTLAQNNQTPRLNNRSLLPRNSLKRVAKDLHMVESNARNGDGDGIGRTRSIPSSAHANLKHGNVHASLGKHSQTGHGQKIEGRNRTELLARRLTTCVETTTCLIRRRDTMGKDFVRDDLSINLHTLGIAHQMRRRKECCLKALTTKNGSRESRRRCLSIGTGYLDAIIELVRTTKLIEHLDDSLEQRRGITRNLARIGRKCNSLIKRKLRNLKRHRIQPRTLCHSQSPLNIKRGP